MTAFSVELIHQDRVLGAVVEANLEEADSRLTRILWSGDRPFTEALALTTHMKGALALHVTPELAAFEVDFAQRRVLLLVPTIQGSARVWTHPDGRQLYRCYSGLETFSADDAITIISDPQHRHPDVIIEGTTIIEGKSWLMELL